MLNIHCIVLFHIQNNPITYILAPLWRWNWCLERLNNFFMKLINWFPNLCFGPALWVIQSLGHALKGCLYCGSTVEMASPYHGVTSVLKYLALGMTEGPFAMNSVTALMPGSSLSTSFCASRCASSFPNLVGERGGRRTKYDQNLSESLMVPISFVLSSLASSCYLGLHVHQCQSYMHY